jgi:hypothetical protein
MADIHRMRRPDGVVVAVPEEMVVPLSKQGFELPMTTSTGEHVYIPMDKMEIARKQGFKFGHEGKWR